MTNNDNMTPRKQMLLVTIAVLAFVALLALVGRSMPLPNQTPDFEDGSMRTGECVAPSMGCTP